MLLWQNEVRCSMTNRMAAVKSNDRRAVHKKSGVRFRLVVLETGLGLVSVSDLSVSQCLRLAEAHFLFLCHYTPPSSVTNHVHFVTQTALALVLSASSLNWQRFELFTKWLWLQQTKDWSIGRLCSTTHAKWSWLSLSWSWSWYSLVLAVSWSQFRRTWLQV